MRFLTHLAVILCSVAAAISAEQTKTLFTEFVESEYESVTASPFATGILYDLVAPISGLEGYDGNGEAPAVTTKQWLQMCYELERASLTSSSIPDFRELKMLGNKEAKRRIYPIAVLDFEYNAFKEAANRNTAIQFEHEKIVSIDENSVETKRVFAATALRDWSYRGSLVRFQIDQSDLYFTNLDEPAATVEIDFDDGAGFRRVDGVTDVHYLRTGEKTVRVRAKRQDEVVESSFRFEVRSLDTPDPTETWQVTATIPHEGNYSSGEVYIYLSEQHSEITNPIILAEGIDLDNSRNWEELYDLLNQEGLVEDVREQGFDIVVLNHDNGTDYIQGNAYLLVELLNQVNAVSAENSSIILVGVSMGGQTTRYALMYMEENDLPHNVSTWIAFDSPHRGANIPLGLQYWVDFFAGQSSDAAEMRDALNSPAAKQMLLVHFTDPPSSNPGTDPMYADYQNELASMGGFPESPRKVAIANGAGNMLGLDFNPGDQLIRWEYSSFLVNITGNAWSLNDVQTNTIFDGEIDQIWPLPDESRTVTVNPEWPYDNAPGGKTNSMEEMDAIDPGYGDIIALEAHHCFIPTVSALNLAVVDPFYDIQANPDIYSLTPFDSIYYPTWNQSHSFIFPENYDWLVGELELTVPEPLVTASPELLNFGQVHVDTSAEMVFTLTNERTWDVQIDAIFPFEGADFSIVSDHSFPLIIPFLSSVEVTVEFDPEEAAQYHDTIRVSVHGIPGFNVPLIGEGVEEQMLLSVDELDFGVVQANTIASLSFYVKNPGTALLTVSDVQSTNDAFVPSLPVVPTSGKRYIRSEKQERSSHSALDEISFWVPPGDSQLVFVEFWPEEAIGYNGNLSVISDLATAGIELSGQGALPEIAVSDDSLLFGSVVVGETSELALTITNSGLWELEIEDIVFETGEVFSMTPESSLPIIVEPQSSMPLTIRFIPAETGFVSDSLTILHDAGDPLGIYLEGTGLQAGLRFVPDTLDFLHVWVQTTQYYPFWIENTGDATLIIDSMYSEDEVFEFIVRDLTIEPDLPQTVTLPCTPPDTLVYTGHLTAVTNIGTFTAFARAQGVWSEVVIEPLSVDLAGVVPNEEIVTSIVMTNLGNALILLDPELTVGSAFQITVPTPPPYLAAYAVDSVVVRFLTMIDTSGVYRDTLKLRSPELYLSWIPFSAEVVSGTDNRETVIPSEFYLSQNYPNPFNPSTTLEFGLPVTSEVVLSVYDLQGRLVKDVVRSSLSAGRHTVQWECRECASGLYLFVMSAGDAKFVRKGMLLK